MKEESCEHDRMLDSVLNGDWSNSVPGSRKTNSIGSQKGADGKVSGGQPGQVQGRQRLGWMDAVKVALGKREMTVEAARQCAKDQKEWRATALGADSQTCLKLSVSQDLYVS